MQVRLRERATDRERDKSEEGLQLWLRQRGETDRETRVRRDFSYD
jgi:hypothetical protein